MRMPTEYNYDDRNLLLLFEKNKKPSCLGLLVSPSYLKIFSTHFPFSSHAFDDVEDKKSRENVEARPTTKRVKIERKRLLWRLVTDHPDIFDTHVVPKLNGNDVKFFYDVNTESRRAVKRSGVQLRNAFKIGDFDTTSTISWALEKCSEKKERFCAQMAKERVSLIA